jgi:hypothetical protein
MNRAMTTGVSTETLKFFGGMEAVTKVLKENNVPIGDRSQMSAAELKAAAEKIANTGVGDLQLLAETNTPLTEAGRAAMAANGVTSFDAAALTKAGIPFQKTANEKVADLSKQLVDLQTAYDTISTKTGTGTGPPVTAPVVGKLSGTATVTPGSVTPVNTSTATGGMGLITGANTLTSTPGTFDIGNTATGNVNTGGLITGAQQQLFTQNAQVGLPTGVTPRIGVMGNSTGGPSIQPNNPYGFNFSMERAKTGGVQNYYNPKTGQRYTAPAGYTPPSSDWQTYTPGAAAGSGVNLNAAAGTGATILG